MDRKSLAIAVLVLIAFWFYWNRNKNTVINQAGDVTYQNPGATVAQYIVQSGPQIDLPKYAGNLAGLTDDGFGYDPVVIDLGRLIYQPSGRAPIEFDLTPFAPANIQSPFDWTTNLGCYCGYGEPMYPIVILPDLDYKSPPVYEYVEPKRLYGSWVSG